MGHYGYLLVIAGFVVLVDLVFLARGHRSRAKKPDSPQYPIPFTERRTHERRGTPQTPAAV